MGVAGVPQGSTVRPVARECHAIQSHALKWHLIIVYYTNSLDIGIGNTVIGNSKIQVGIILLHCSCMSCMITKLIKMFLYFFCVSYYFAGWSGMDNIEWSDSDNIRWSDRDNNGWSDRDNTGWSDSDNIGWNDRNNTGWSVRDNIG